MAAISFISPGGCRTISSWSTRRPTGIQNRDLLAAAAGQIALVVEHANRAAASLGRTSSEQQPIPLRLVVGRHAAPLRGVLRPSAAPRWRAIRAKRPPATSLSKTAVPREPSLSASDRRAMAVEMLAGQGQIADTNIPAGRHCGALARRPALASMSSSACHADGRPWPPPPRQAKGGAGRLDHRGECWHEPSGCGYQSFWKSWRPLLAASRHPAPHEARSRSRCPSNPGRVPRRTHRAGGARSGLQRWTGETPSKFRVRPRSGM